MATFERVKTLRFFSSSDKEDKEICHVLSMTEIYYTAYQMGKYFFYEFKSEKDMEDAAKFLSYCKIEVQ